METALIQPIRFLVFTLSVAANSTYTPMPGHTTLPPVELGAGLAQLPQEEGPPAVRCDVQVRTPLVNADGVPFPYAVETRVGAIFTAVREIPFDEQAFKRLLAFNGLPIVYGFARDLVLQATAFGIHGPFPLPSLNVSSVSQTLLETPYTNPSDAPVEPTAPEQQSESAMPARARRPRRSAGRG